MKLPMNIINWSRSAVLVATWRKFASIISQRNNKSIQFEVKLQSEMTKHSQKHI